MTLVALAPGAVEMRDAINQAFTAWDVVKHLSLQAGVSPLHIRGQRRQREYVVIRRAIALELLARGYSYSAIGRVLGGRHHTTIMALVKRPRRYIEREKLTATKET